MFCSINFPLIDKLVIVPTLSSLFRMRSLLSDTCIFLKGSVNARWLHLPVPTVRWVKAWNHQSNVIAETQRKKNTLQWDASISNMAWYHFCFLIGPVRVINHTFWPHVMTYIDAEKGLFICLHCWMQLVEESLHDVICNVCDSYISAGKIILPYPQSEKWNGSQRHHISSPLYLADCCFFQRCKKELIFLHLWVRCQRDSRLFQRSFNTRLTEKTPWENIKDHARLHVHKDWCLLQEKALCFTLCLYVCVCVRAGKEGNPCKQSLITYISLSWMHIVYI